MSVSPAVPARWQQTLCAPVHCAGTGLHTGLPVQMTLCPAAVDHGICFVRTDLPDGQNQIKIGQAKIIETNRATRIANSTGAELGTVEHLLASFAGLGIDNVRIEIDGPEVPTMDGCASAFCELVTQVGLVGQSAPRTYIRVLQKVSVTDGSARASFTPNDHTPNDHTLLDVGIDYDNPVIGRQSCQFEVNPQTFADEIAPARTFALRSEVAALQKASKALGGTLDNCLVVGPGNIENPGGLKFKNEFARHKALDALGDLTMAGAPILGLYHARCGGHRINALAVAALLAEPSAWEKVTF